MIIEYLRGLFKKEEKPKECEHSQVVKGNYGGFFDFDTYTCVGCNKVWDESVVFSGNEKTKGEWRSLQKAIQGGKITVVRNTSKVVTNFVTDDGYGLKVCLARVGKGKSLREEE